MVTHRYEGKRVLKVCGLRGLGQYKTKSGAGQMVVCSRHEAPHLFILASLGDKTELATSGSTRHLSFAN